MKECKEIKENIFSKDKVNKDKVSKERLDVLIYSRGLTESREKASVIIMTGNVYVNGQKSDKAGCKYPTNAEIEIKGASIPFVSRGGLKLDKAIKTFGLELENKIAMDVGASTGGFTDCMLQNGAIRVYSVDVGYGQLAWKLRIDPRVINLERTNVRYLNHEQVPEKVDFISIDVAFISLRLVLPSLVDFLQDSGRIICLIKPQFEAGRGKVGKKGVVRDINVHIEVVNDIVNFCRDRLNFKILGLDYSPVKGPEGNIEYLLLLGKDGEEMPNYEDHYLEVIKRSHENL